MRIETFEEWLQECNHLVVNQLGKSLSECPRWDWQLDYDNNVAADQAVADYLEDLQETYDE